jgi:hypothetical protein
VRPTIQTMLVADWYCVTPRHKARRIAANIAKLPALLEREE